MTGIIREVLRRVYHLVGRAYLIYLSWFERGLNLLGVRLCVLIEEMNQVCLFGGIAVFFRDPVVLFVLFVMANVRVVRGGARVEVVVF